MLEGAAMCTCSILHVDNVQENESVLPLVGTSLQLIHMCIKGVIAHVLAYNYVIRRREPYYFIVYRIPQKIAFH